MSGPQPVEKSKLWNTTPGGSQPADQCKEQVRDKFFASTWEPGNVYTRKREFEEVDEDGKTRVDTLWDGPMRKRSTVMNTMNRLAGDDLAKKCIEYKCDEVRTHKFTECFRFEQSEEDKQSGRVDTANRESESGGLETVVSICDEASPSVPTCEAGGRFTTFPNPTHQLEPPEETRRVNISTLSEHMIRRINNIALAYNNERENSPFNKEVAEHKASKDVACEIVAPLLASVMAASEKLQGFHNKGAVYANVALEVIQAVLIALKSQVCK